MKLIDDLLKSPNGKYSRKSVIIMLTFIFTLVIGAYATIEDKPTAVFDSLLLFLTAMICGTIYDKKVENKSVPNTTEEVTEI